MEEKLVEFANLLRQNGVRVSLAETLEFLRSLPDGLFDERMPILKERRGTLAPAAVGARS